MARDVNTRRPESRVAHNRAVVRFEAPVPHYSQFYLVCPQIRESLPPELRRTLLLRSESTIRHTAGGESGSGGGHR